MTTEQQKAFEKWFRSAIYNHDYDVRKCRTTGNYQEGRTSDMWIAWQASRQHIIDKLQSEEMVEVITQAVAIAVKKHIAIHGSGRPILYDASAVAKAAIAAVLEGV